ncbi:MAG: type I methionyl aminopeptidase [Planctomycetota bacterium]
MLNSAKPARRYSKDQILKIRAAGRLVAECHALMKKSVVPGVTTRQLDQMVEAHVLQAGGRPAWKGIIPANDPKTPFPAITCMSPDDMIVHGEPSDTPLREGQIISIDIGAVVDGFIGDSAWTYPVGKISAEAARLLEVGEASLMKGIAAAKAGGVVADIGRAVQQYAEAARFSVVREYTGHGVGLSLWEPPQVPNYATLKDFLPGASPRLYAGMVLAIEPMINVGGPGTRNGRGEWPVYTADGSLSCHFEHTVAIGENGCEIMTSL